MVEYGFPSAKMENTQHMRKDREMAVLAFESGAAVAGAVPVCRDTAFVYDNADKMLKNHHSLPPHPEPDAIER